MLAEKTNTSCTSSGFYRVCSPGLLPVSTELFKPQRTLRATSCQLLTPSANLEPNPKTFLQPRRDKVKIGALVPIRDSGKALENTTHLRSGRAPSFPGRCGTGTEV